MSDPANQPPAGLTAPTGSDLASEVDAVLRHSLAAVTITPEAKALLDAVKAKALTPPATAARSSNQCECCSSQLAKPLRLGKTRRDICDDCLGFMARWWIELGIWEMPDPESPTAKTND